MLIRYSKMISLSKMAATRPQAFGFTLVELMIALLLGVIVIGGIITIFVSNQQTYRTTVAMDNAQEAFRFAQHTITRVARSAGCPPNPDPDVCLAVRTDSNTTTLRLEIPRDGITQNCLGVRLAEQLDEEGLPEFQLNEFSFARPNLLCSVEGDDPSIIVTGIDLLQFSYGVLNSAAYTQDSDAPYTLGVAGEGANSIRTRIRMVDGGGLIRAPEIEFTSAVRAPLLPEPIIIVPGQP